MKNKFLIAGAIVLAVLAGFIILNNLQKPGISEPKRQRSAVSLSGLLNQARSLEGKGALLEAKNAYQGLIDNFGGSAEIANWQKKIEELNIKLLFSPVITASPKSAVYEIKPGDTLTKIAKAFKTTQELIMKSNNLSGDKIIPGRKIKVLTATLSIVADKSQNTLMLKADEEIIKTYTVSTGINNSTPSGAFKIVNKLPNPTWFKAGAVVPSGSPENILGTRWLGFDLAGYGIHGTSEPQNLGKQVTQGCIRMANPDVEELYAIIPVGTEVAIVD